MPVKDRVVNWWIQNIIIPKQEIIDKPGFIVTTFTEKKFTTYLREFFIPEHLFETIENDIVKKYGDAGRQVLYSSGKKFGYIYASLSNFTTVKNSTPDEITKFAYLLVRYIEGTYAEGASHEANVLQNRFKIYFDNYVICRNNGIGHIMTEGGITGIWAYGMQNNSIEGVQTQCQGRGDDNCCVICAPSNEIRGITKNFFKEPNLTDIKAESGYEILNKIRDATYVKNSLKDLLDAGFFTYEKGILSFKDHRFFHCESHILYLLEEEITKLENGEEILFNSCRKYGELLAESYGGEDYKTFISDFFSALGFGDIFIYNSNKLRISFLYYPWTTFSKKSRYIILRGIMSGIVSSLSRKKIIFGEVEIDIGEFLTITISE